MPEILRFEFIQQFPTFIATLLYFLFWGSVAILIVLVVAAVYDKFWGPLNGDFLQGIEAWIGRMVYPRIRTEVPDFEDSQTEERFVREIKRFTELRKRTGIGGAAFDWPTFTVRNRPFDREWD